MSYEPKFNKTQETFKLIPKYTKYIEYMIDLIIKIPRTEKFSIGTEYKEVMYKTFENIMYLSKIEDKDKMYYLNKIDAGINIQRALLRIMKNYKWISEKQFEVVMLNLLSEIGKITGGLIKYYAQNNKKSV